jgi:hypothetical protein
MSRSMLSTITDSERRVLQVVAQGTVSRAEIIARAGLGQAEVEHSLDTLWCSGFIECAREYFSATGGPASELWRYTILDRGLAALADAA